MCWIVFLATAVIANEFDWSGGKMPHSTPNFTIDGGSVSRQIDIAHTLKDLKNVDTFTGWTMILIGHWDPYCAELKPCWHRQEVHGAKSILEAFPSSGFEVPTATNRVAGLLQLLSDLNGRFLSVSSLISMQHACVITHYYTLGVRERSVQTEPRRCLERKSPFSCL